MSRIEGRDDWATEDEEREAMGLPKREHHRAGLTESDDWTPVDTNEMITFAGEEWCPLILPPKIQEITDRAVNKLIKDRGQG